MMQTLRQCLWLRNYNAGLFIQRLVKYRHGLEYPWPPRATDLNLFTIKSLVLVALLHWLACITGFTFPVMNPLE